MTSVAVKEFPKCVCGKDAKHRCPVCDRSFCTNQGCPRNGEHHSATIDVVVITRLGEKDGSQ